MSEASIGRSLSISKSAKKEVKAKVANFPIQIVTSTETIVCRDPVE